MIITAITHSCSLRDRVIAAIHNSNEQYQQ